MPGRLTNKVAIITGASSGIGRATALAFAAEGAHLVCSDIREDFKTEFRTDNLDGTTVEEVQKLGAKAIYVQCNTTSAADVEALVAKAVETYGRLDIMVNNAGIAVEAGDHGSRPVWEVDESAYAKTLDVNVKGVFLGVKYASKQMITQEPHENGDRGWIINLASVFGLVASANTASYVSSKHAVMGLTKAAALDCAPQRIHVNALCPGFTRTAFIATMLSPEADQYRGGIEALHPFRGLGTPQDIAKAAVFLASEDAGWISGIGLPVDGGYTCM